MHRNTSPTIPSLPCRFELLVPHKPPILLNANLVEVGNKETSDTQSLVAARAPLNGPFYHKGKILPEYCVELLAQSTAALQGYCSLKGNKQPGKGFLVTIDHFTWFTYPAPGDQLSVTFREIISFDQFHIYEGAIRAGQTQLCQGRFKIWADQTKGGFNSLAHEDAQPCSSIARSLVQEALCKVNPEDANGTFYFPESFPGFRGHFPGNPLLPAIVQTAGVQILAEKMLKTKLTAVSAKNIKFEKIILPEESVLFSLQMKKTSTGIKIFFILSVKHEKRSSGELTYIF